jgi:seryl-tRNA synthetase
MVQPVRNGGQTQSQGSDPLLRLLHAALLTTPEAEQALAAIAGEEPDALAPALARRALTHMVAELFHEAMAQAAALSSKTSQASVSLPEKDREAAELATAVRELQQECQALRQSLARAEEERNLYLKALYAKARETIPFEDVDIPELEKTSAGPVETLE